MKAFIIDTLVMVLILIFLIVSFLLFNWTYVYLVTEVEDNIRDELIANETLCEYNGDENGRNERTGLGSLDFAPY